MVPGARVTHHSRMRPLLGIALFALLVRVAILAVRHDAPIDMDGAEYARLAQNLLAGHGFVGMRGTPMLEYPPLFPLLIAMLLPLVHDAQLAGGIVATLCGTLLVAGVWLTADELYGKRVAFLAGLIVALVPMTTSLATTVLADAPFEAAIVFGVWFTLRVLRAWRTVDAAAAAVCFVLAYLARPEGIAFAVVALAVFGVIAVRTPGARRPAFVFAATAFIVVLPYVVYTFQTSGRVVIEGKSAINAALAQGLRRGDSYLAVADALDDRGRPVGPEIDPRYYEPHAAPPVIPLQARLSMALAAETRHVRDVVVTFAGSEYGKGLLVVLAVIGLGRTRWSPERMRGETVLLTSVLLLFVALGSVWHFWDRYAASFVPFVAIWAAKGIDELRVWSRAARVPNLGFAALAAFALLSIAINARLAFADRDAPERAAGAWIARTVPHASVIDISDLAAFYAGATWSPLPFARETLACDYLMQQRPDVLVIDTSRAQDYPPLASWFAQGPTCRQAVLAYSIDRLRVYRWISDQAALERLREPRFVRSARTDLASKSPRG